MCLQRPKLGEIKLKTLFVALMTLFAVSAQALPVDQCYALFNEQSLNGAICFSGWAEESIGGQIITVALLDNQGKVYYCNKSTSVEYNLNNEVEYSIKLILPRTSITLEGKSDESFGTLLNVDQKMNFSPLSQATNDRVYNRTFQSAECRSL
jgi:hypothetical protein